MRYKTQYEVNYWDNVGRGIVPDTIPVNKFGRNPSVSTSTPEDIWDTGSDFVEPPTAELCNVSSTSPNDDLGNTGAEHVELRGIGGLNGEYNLVSEIVEMNGVGDILTQNKYWFVHRVKVTQAGATGNNVGTITIITTATGTATLASILPTNNKTFMAMMMVPDGYNLWIKHWNSSVRLQVGGAGEYELWCKPIGQVFQPVSAQGVATQAGLSRTLFEPLIRFTPSSIVKVRVVELSAASMTCYSEFHGSLEKVVEPAPPAI